MSFTCKIEPADYRRAAWVHIRPRRFFAILGTLLVLLALSVFAFALHRFVTTGEDLIVLLVLGVALAYLAVYFLVWFPRRLTRLYEQQRLLHPEFTVEISDEHLVSRSALGESKLPWGLFHKWKSGGDVVLVYQSDELFHVFPARSFPSAMDFERFQDILRKHLGPQKA